MSLPASIKLTVEGFMCARRANSAWDQRRRFLSEANFIVVSFRGVVEFSSLIIYYVTVYVLVKRDTE